MNDVALLLLQITTSIAPTTDARERLLHPVLPANCYSSPNEIVVCGQDADAYRLPKTGPTAAEPSLPNAEWQLFGDTKMNAHAIERTLGAAVYVPAAMVTITVPF